MRHELGEKISGLFVCAFELAPQNAQFAINYCTNKGELDAIFVSEYSYSTPDIYPQNTANSTVILSSNRRFKNKASARRFKAGVSSGR